MNADKFDVGALLAMAHSPIRNYIIPGLTSSLIGMPGPTGTLRLFENERDHQENVAPHSHRFDFQCWVLRGRVVNRLWRCVSVYDKDSDWFRRTRQTYLGAVGKYETWPIDTLEKWAYRDEQFNEGECYAMKHDALHSIKFSRGAKVLFFEGKQLTEHSYFLEPAPGQRPVPTFKTEPWMFEREPPPTASGLQPKRGDQMNKETS